MPNQLPALLLRRRRPSLLSPLATITTTTTATRLFSRTRAPRALFPLAALSNAHETRWLARASGLPHVEHSPALQLLRSEAAMAAREAGGGGGGGDGEPAADLPFSKDDQGVGDSRTKGSDYHDDAAVRRAEGTCVGGVREGGEEEGGGGASAARAERGPRRTRRALWALCGAAVGAWGLWSWAGRVEVVLGERGTGTGTGRGRMVRMEGREDGARAVVVDAGERRLGTPGRQEVPEPEPEPELGTTRRESSEYARRQLTWRSLLWKDG